MPKGEKRERENYELNSTPIMDNGYTRICLICNDRFDQKPTLVGKERLVNVGICPECLLKERRFPSYGLA